MKAGLLTIIAEFLPGLDVMLPPEHRVEAVRPVNDLAGDLHEAIISGPMLLDWPDQAVPPGKVVIVMTMQEAPPHLRAMLTGHFGFFSIDAPKSASWKIADLALPELLEAGRNGTLFDVIRKSRAG